MITPEQLAEFRQQVIACAPPIRELYVAKVEDRTDAPVPIRVYTPHGDGPFPTIVYVHGAGFVAGNLDSHDGIQRYLCDALAAEVVAIDYRLAPEHPWPAAFDDVYAVLRWLDGPVVLVGESAGAHLTATCALRARDDVDGPGIVHQALLYAALDAGNPVYAHFFQAYFTDPVAARSGYGSPVWLDEADLEDLPPALCLWGELEPTRAEQELYARKLAAAGVPVATYMAPAIGHGVYELKAASDRQDVLDAITSSLAPSVEALRRR